MTRVLTHPTPKRYALAVSAVGAVDHGITSDVSENADGSVTVTFENGYAVSFVKGRLLAEYRL